LADKRNLISTLEDIKALRKTLHGEDRSPIANALIAFTAKGLEAVSKPSETSIETDVARFNVALALPLILWA
jgi:hypothetical protein